MSQLYDGQWADTPPAAEEIGEDGRFRRIDSPLRAWISPDPDAEFPAEAGRYHLFVAWVCPWASRVTAYRVLKGLEGVISLSASDGVIGNELGRLEVPLHRRVLHELDVAEVGKALAADRIARRVDAGPDVHARQVGNRVRVLGAREAADGDASGLARVPGVVGVQR